jgi:hypothetical protein
MAQGLIAAALGGFGKGLATVGEMEAKKQNEFNLKKQIMDMESEERLRIDEITRKRDIEGIGAKTAATAKANLEAAPLVGQAEVATKTSRLAAAKTNKLYEEEAEADVRGQMAKLDARKTFEADKREAEADADKRLAELNAEKDKGVTKVEAERNARVEKEKYTAMDTANVPKAKQDYLMKEWNAAKAQRDAAAVEAIENAIKAEIEKNKGLSTKENLANVRKIKTAESAGNIAEINAREAARDKKEKTERPRNTADMQRQITATERQIADALGVEPKKANDEKQYLEDRAATGKATPAEKAKLAKIKPLSDELDALRQDLRSFKRSDSSSPSEKTSYDYVPGKGLVETKK